MLKGVLDVFTIADYFLSINKEPKAMPPLSYSKQLIVHLGLVT
jgi:hypothetical protein